MWKSFALVATIAMHNTTTFCKFDRSLMHPALI